MKMKAIFEFKKPPKKCAECRSLSFAKANNEKIPYCFLADGKLLSVGFDIESGRDPICPLKFVMSSKEAGDRWV